MIVVFDIDGVLCDSSAGFELVPKDGAAPEREFAAWADFINSTPDLPVVAGAVEAVSSLLFYATPDVEFCFLTSRNLAQSEATAQWLYEHFPGLYYRAQGSIWFRPREHETGWTGTASKLERLSSLQAYHPSRPFVLFDDDPGMGEFARPILDTFVHIPRAGWPPLPQAFIREVVCSS